MAVSMEKPPLPHPLSPGVMSGYETAGDNGVQVMKFSENCRVHWA
eukprot:CAMPEP_0173185786 /NCGR_PEP_ID=MMETSP1141-20130122/9758_1 /TAXON_ID=483371 /ORGANISM="non described non described, Strain CCMP2298" /LENGTH=44 /DNA_ID= /DNA_START= /DNA_END= /DNA_ORIENTATION=